MSSSDIEAEMTLDVNIARKSYVAQQGENLIVENVRFCASPGEIIGLFGSSGCGKSTCLRIVSGLDRSFVGEVRIDGTAIDGPTRAIGLVPQGQVTYDWLTVGGNIAFGLRYAPLEGEGTELVGSRKLESRNSQEVLTLAALVGLSPLDLAKYPQELSGGMKQRMAFARALLLKPRILLLDEPFSSLDLDAREALQDVVLKVRSELGTCVICVSHDPEEVLYLADRVMVFGGRPTTIVESFSPELPGRERDIRYSTAFQLAKRHLRAWLEPLPAAGSQDRRTGEL